MKSQSLPTRNIPIRIVLADDNDVVRSSLKLFIQTNPDLLFVGEASNGYEAISSCILNQPDLVLMDIDMPVLNGIEATRIITQKCPGVQILALTSISDNGTTKEMIEAGAITVISKQISIDDINRIIRESFNNRQKSSSEPRISEDTKDQDRTVKR